MSEDPYLQVAGPPAEVVNPDGEGEPAAAPEESQSTKIFNLVKSVAMQAMMMYFVMSIFKKAPAQQQGNILHLFVMLYLLFSWNRWSGSYCEVSCH